jgi:hypothetical protein
MEARSQSPALQNESKSQLEYLLMEGDAANRETAYDPLQERVPSTFLLG